MGKLPSKSQMAAIQAKDEEANEEPGKAVKPAKAVMQAIGKSILAPPKKKKAPKVKNGPSTQNTKKQNRVDKTEMSKDADEQE